MYQTDKFAIARAAKAGEKAAFELHNRLMRSPLTAAEYGVRPWPEVLTAETVASWIVSNVSYSNPRDAYAILNALVAENNA